MIRFTKVRDVKCPVYSSEYSAGIDFFVPSDFSEKWVFPGEDILIPSGIKIEIPEGFALLGVDKSGIALSNDEKFEFGLPEDKDISSSLIVGAKLIDQDYDKEFHIHLINVGKKPCLIKPGRKIAQFILVPIMRGLLVEVPEKDLIYPTSSRDGGFSSTGKY